jgi:hypothetical protein
VQGEVGGGFGFTDGGDAPVVLGAQFVKDAGVVRAAGGVRGGGDAGVDLGRVSTLR